VTRNSVIGEQVLAPRDPRSTVVAALLLFTSLAPAAVWAADRGTSEPEDAQSGFVIVGPAGASWNGVKAGNAPAGGGPGLTSLDAQVKNNRANGSSGLSLNLWITPVSDGVPVISPLINFQYLGGVSLGNVKSGQTVTVQQGGLRYIGGDLPRGCYYAMLALLNETVLVDLFPFSNNPTQGIPSPSGYNIYSFGGANCASLVPPASGPCEESATAACLIGGRFQVTTNFYNATGGKAQAPVISFNSTRAESDESVFYSFADPSNVEMIVKVINGCALNNHYWVFIAGATTQGWEAAVVDTQTGAAKSYLNNLNILTATTADTSALPCP
jgi:hypothetical protein